MRMSSLVLSGRYLQLAWRLLVRSRRRTLLTLGSLVFGVLVLIVSLAVTQAGLASQIEQVCRATSGHVQLQAPRFFETHKASLALQPIPLQRLQAIAPQIQGTEVRHVLSGVLTGTSEDGHVVVGRGVPDRLAASEPPYPIEIGAYAADSLGVSAGDSITLTYRRADAQYASTALKIAAVTDEGTPTGNRRRITINGAVADKLLGLAGRAHRQLIFTDSAADADQVAAALRTGLGADVRVLTWHEVNPQMRRYSRYGRSMLMLLTGIVGMLSLFGVASLIVMSVAERSHELAMMAAVGMTPAQIIFCVLAEGAVLGLTTLATAAPIAWALLTYLASNGIDLTPASGEAIVLDGVRLEMLVHPVLSWSHFALAAGVVLLTSLLASLGVALRVATRDPFAGMRS